MKVTEKYIFFWNDWLSNFTRSEFTWTFMNQTHTFFCSEQAFMWAKAMFFKDCETANKILDENTDPMKCKKLGREVQNYDEKMWDGIRFEIMYMVNLQKYRDNATLRDALLKYDYDGKSFVEASPYDRIWGIGMRESDENIDNPSYWRGRNLLGKVLDNVRYTLRTEKSGFHIV